MMVVKQVGLSSVTIYYNMRPGLGLQVKINKILGIVLSDVPRHFPLKGGGVSPIDQLFLIKRKKVTKNTVTSSPAACLTFDQPSCKFDNIGGRDAPHASPVGTPLMVLLIINVKATQN